MMENNEIIDENYTSPYVLVFNSTILFMLAYAFVYTFPLMATEYMAKSSGIAIKFIDYRIEYLTPDDSNAWSKDNIINIFGVGPGITFTMSFLFWYLAYEMRASSGLFKLFFTWAYVISFNLTFGGIIAGISTFDGLLYVFNWSGLATGSTLVLGIVSGFILFFVGKLARVSFLRASYERDWIIMPKSQIIFKLRTIYLPYLIGSALFTLLSFPSNLIYDKLQLATMLIIFFSTMRYYNPDIIRLTKNRKKQYLAIGFILIFIVYFSILTLWVRL